MDIRLLIWRWKCLLRQKLSHWRSFILTLITMTNFYKTSKIIIMNIVKTVLSQKKVRKLYFVKILLVVCMAFAPLCAQAKLGVPKIDAPKNAVNHNNRGVIYMQDRDYAAAIKELQMAD